MLKRLSLILLLSIFCFTALLTSTDRAQATIQNQSGPALGDTIELKSWSTRDGRSLAQEMKSHSLAMILLVNPTCGTCTSAKEGFQKLRENVAQPGIPYFVLMMPDSSDVQKYFSYADSLRLEAESFVWSSKESKPPTSLATMAVPSHLLVTNEGLVVNKWPGTPPKE